MKLVKRTFLYTLLCVLLLIAAVAVKTYRDTEEVIEYLVSSFTAYELHIERSVAVQFVDGWASFVLVDSWMESKQGDRLLNAGRISARVRLADLTKSDLILHEIKATDLEVFIERDEQGTLNWLSGESASEQSPTAPMPDADQDGWELRLGKIDVRNASVSMLGFSEQKQLLQLQSIALSGFDADRSFTLAGDWNGYALTVDGDMRHGLDFLKSSPASAKSFDLNAKAALAGIRVSVDGSIGDQTSDVRLALSTDNFDLLSTMLAVDLPALGEIDFESRLTLAEQKLHFQDLSLAITGKDLTLRLQGEASQLADDYHADLQWSVQSHDLSELDIRDTYEALSGWHIDGRGALSYGGGEARLSKTNVKAGNGNHQFSLAVDKAQLTQQQWQQFDIDLTNSQLNYLLIDGEQQWGYQYPADRLTVSVSPQRDIQLSTLGVYKSMPLSLAGQWAKSGDYHLDGVVDGADVSVKGYVKNGAFNIVGKLEAENLSPLSKLLDRPLIEVGRAEVSIDVLVKDDKAIMQNLDVLLRKDNSRIAVKGRIGNFFQVDNYRFDIDISTASLDALDLWLADHDTRIENTVSSFTNTCSLASEGDVEVCQNKLVPMRWLSNTTELLSVRKWLALTNKADGHLLASLSVGEVDSALFVSMPEIHLNSEQLNIDWKGEVLETNQVIAVNGELSAKIQQGVIDSLKTPLMVSSRVDLVGNGPLKLQSLHAKAGLTDVSADVALHIEEGELALVDGKVNFTRLDLRPYLPGPKAEEGGASPADHSPPKKASLIPDQDIDLSWLPGHHLDINLVIDDLLTPGFQLKKLNANVKRSKQWFSVDPFSADFDGSPLRGRLIIKDKPINPQMAIYFEGRQLPAGDNRLFVDFNLMKAGKADILLDLSGTGSNVKQLLGSANGRVSLVARKATMNGRGLDNVAPEVLSEINRRLNPFKREKKQDTELECGVVHFDIAKGLMSADKSIVLVTPNISFGAHGVIDLNKEQLRMQVVPRTRKGLGLSFKGTFAKMAVVSGSLDDPQVEFDPTGAITSGSIDVAGTVLYGPLYWLYLGQAQKILASSKACDRAIRSHVPEFDKPASDTSFLNSMLPTQWRGSVEQWVPF